MPRYRYGAYRDGPDPLAAPYDLGRVVDDIADRIMAGSSVAQALRDLFRSGTEDQRGLADLRRRIQQRRRELSEQGRLGGTLDEVRELLDQALSAEQDYLFPDPSDDARFREAQLANVSPDTASAVRELTDYDWQSPEAKAAFNELRELLQRQVLDQQFAGMSQALSSPGSPADQQRMKDMLSDLNQMMAAHRNGDDVREMFAEFMAAHGEFFPDTPETFEELLDDLARRAAAMQRMLDSMSPEQREQLAALMDQAMADLDISAQMSQLRDHLQSLRPDLPWQGAQRMRGEQGMNLPDATSALAEMADLEALDSQLGQNYPGATLDDVDVEAVERALGRSAADDITQLKEIERRLREQGYLTDRLELSPKTMRRIGLTALKRVFADADAGRRGDHDVRRSGASGEFTGQTRPWEFGDEQPLDVVKTVSNAIQRNVAAAGTGPMQLRPEDFEVRETNTQTRAAVALLVDQSFSMVMNDTWQSAKTTALALHHLSTSTYPLDAMQIITFANLARTVKPEELPNLDAGDLQGTNLHHALLLAGRFFDQHPGAQPVCLVVTDGEPTAYLRGDGDWWFMWPPDAQTVRETVGAVDQLTRRGIAISWFRLGDDPRLERFLDAMARRNCGRVLGVDGQRLGRYVVTDYMRARRGH